MSGAIDITIPPAPKLRTIDYVPPTLHGDIFEPRAFVRYFVSGLIVIGLAFFSAFWLLAVHVHLNIWWFESLGLGSVYGTMWSAQKTLFLEYSVITYVILTVVFFVTRTFTYRPGPDLGVRAVDRLVTWISGSITMVAAMMIGSAVSGLWQTYLLAQHAQSFGIPDPIHHKDIGFYVFTLPWREVLGNYAIGLIVLGGIEIAGLVSIYTITSPYQNPDNDIRRMVSVGSLVLAAIFAYLSWRNFFLNPYNLQQPGVAYGAGATFAHSSLWWMPIVGIVELLTGLILLSNSFLKKIPLVGVAVLPVVVGLASQAGQGIFQKFVVAPNELSAEFPYLSNTLSFTRRAYGMDSWHVREYTPRPLTTADINSSQATVQDARITDTAATTQVLRQRQENRTYYTFNSANIDRYLVGGHVRQVVLAARELGFWKLPAQAQTWVNEHINYTHGYGLTMAPANTVTRAGQPVLWIENVPVQETIKDLPTVRQPRIYFGEDTNSWVLANATRAEFDSSTADRDVTSYRYSGPDGVIVGSGTKRLSIAWAVEGGFPFFDRLQISSYLTPKTRILLHRNIFDRVSTIAPWLTLDGDPYIVLRNNGSLVWMMDGMTHSDHYPYSDPTFGDNYRRNSVKIVVDAYTGRTSFYAFDASDPILRAWEAVFPNLIQPLSHLPADLRAHIRYPASYLTWQATAYERYHVTNATSYYNGDNEWDIEQSQGSQLPPIWTEARLFGGHQDSFFSILPFSIRGKAPMAGYIAADNNTYDVTALDMPRGAQTLGAQQFESLYNQAPTISSTLTLLDQHGSQVLPGQLLILPVGKALLYIEPLYLRSSSGLSIPQLIRIVVGTQNAVNWGFTLRGAINNFLTQGDISSVSQGPAGSPPPSPQSTAIPALTATAKQYAHFGTAKLIALANTYYQAAQRTPSLTEKDKDLQQIGLILNVLRGRSSPP